MSDKPQHTNLLFARRERDRVGVQASSTAQHSWHEIAIQNAAIDRAYDDLLAQVERLTEQRDELAAALQDIHANIMLHDDWAKKVPFDLAETARTALAALKGEDNDQE